MPLSSTIVITTKNRKDELRVAIQSCLRQSVPSEILVIDDGSTDGTSEMVRSEFPTVRVDRSEQSLGLIGQRTRAAKLATGDVIFSIDDDAIFVSPQTVGQVLAAFDHPRVGAVAIPYSEPRKPSGGVKFQPPDARVWVVANYVGCAHALRRDLFIALGSYHSYLFRQGEETDYSMRLHNAGYIVRAGAADPMEHLESPKRDHQAIYVYGARNTMLLAWYNTPGHFLPIHWAGSVINLARHAIRKRHPLWVAKGLLQSIPACVHEWAERKPVSTQGYKAYRTILKRGPMPLEEIESTLPPIRPVEEIK